MAQPVIKELESEKEILKAFPIMKQLRTHLDKDTYLDLVKEAVEKDSYKMFALVDEGELAAIIGFKPMITLYYGRFVWICDLVTDASKRSNGYGEQLLTYIQQWAKVHNYESVALSSGLQRKAAHHFYEAKMDYEKVSYVFKKHIT